ncbi:MAG: PQQ-binding-like beta-propeller repeat protein [Pirellulaceae bacterium]
MRILLFATMLGLFVVGCQRSDDTVVDPNTSDAAMNQAPDTQTRLTGFATAPPFADRSASVAPVVLTAAESQQGDWLDWRGPYFNGYSPVTGLPDEFDPDGGEGSNVAWKAPFGGRSTPVIMNGKLYTLVRAEPETAREGERIVCLDAKTGELIWENRFNVYLSDVPDTRVGWSSVVADPETNAVYGLGVCGHFVCADADTGETRWQIPLHERFGLLSTYGGRTNFPVICDDLVIVVPSSLVGATPPSQIIALLDSINARVKSFGSMALEIFRMTLRTVVRC